MLAVNSSLNNALVSFQLTPFNMKEEMDEGHFDTEGHFVWKKTDNIKDHWLDNLDWVKVSKFNLIN